MRQPSSWSSDDDDDFQLETVVDVSRRSVSAGPGTLRKRPKVLSARGSIGHGLALQELHPNVLGLGPHQAPKDQCAPPPRDGGCPTPAVGTACTGEAAAGHGGVSIDEAGSGGESGGGGSLGAGSPGAAPGTCPVCQVSLLGVPGGALRHVNRCLDDLEAAGRCSGSEEEMFGGNPPPPVGEEAGFSEASRQCQPLPPPSLPLAEWLLSAGIGQRHAETLATHGVSDVRQLMALSAGGLKAAGLPLGPRKRIELALRNEELEGPGSRPRGIARGSGGATSACCCESGGSLAVPGQKNGAAVQGGGGGRGGEQGSSPVGGARNLHREPPPVVSPRRLAHLAPAAAAAPAPRPPARGEEWCITDFFTGANKRRGTPAADIPAPQVQASIASFFAGGGGGASGAMVGPQHSASGAPRGSRAVSAGGGGAGGGTPSTVHGKPGAAKGPRATPPWVQIPGTPGFLVDGFAAAAPKNAGRCASWFLTHFHSDHYRGLTKGWAKGQVYCSPITARLVHEKIGVPWERLRPIPLMQPTTIEGVKVTFTDANHCPGAVLILFEPSYPATATLHTGDFRYHPRMRQCPLLQAARYRVLCILDTTYCDPQYTFPPADEVVDYVVKAIRAEAFNCPRTLFLVGSYTIGKERVFLEAARALGTKVYVGASKRRVLDAIELSQEDRALITEDDRESCVHAVPLWSVSFKRMSSILKFYRGRYDTVVGFAPTGWSFDRGLKAQPGRRKAKGTMVVYQVPYSEHSSFSELREFLAWLRPRETIPSVNHRSTGHAQGLVRSLL